MAIRVLLADDHRIFRKGLRSLLEDIPYISIIGETADGRSAVREVEKQRPDVVLMDISMPDLNGIEATRQIKQANPDTVVLGLSMHEDERFVGEMLRAGADGYLSKKCDTDELAAAIRTAMKGQTFISPSVASDLVHGYIRNQAPDQAMFSLLTDREREVLQLVAEEKSVKEIASILNLSPKTVHTHRENIMSKLKNHSVAGLTKYALRCGLIEL